MTATSLRPSGRTDAGAAAVALAAAAGAWALTADRMAGMDAGLGSDLGGLGWFAVSWTLMMAAMMLPAITPMVAAYGGRAVRPGATALFAAAYLATSRRCAPWSWASSRGRRRAATSRPA